MNSFAQLCWASLLVLLTSCGGGGGGSSSPAGGTPTTSAFSGVAIDGYLYLARAFLDLNGNGTYDNGEPTAITASDGTFALTATQDQINSHSVVVSAIAGTTIDQDTPNTPLTSGFTMMSPAGSHSVVSPLTTQVAAKMASGLTFDLAKEAVKTEMGLTSIDVMKNYISEKANNSDYSDAHKVATSIAEALKNIEQQSAATLAIRLTNINAQIALSVTPVLTQIKSAQSFDDVKKVINTKIAAGVVALVAKVDSLEISIGLSTQINTSYKSADGTSNELEGSSLTYTSSNSEILTVTKEGLVNAMGPGVASIAIIYKNTQTTLEITVTNGVYPIGFSGQVYN
jgi:hypothetical protein